MGPKLKISILSLKEITLHTFSIFFDKNGVKTKQYQLCPSRTPALSWLWTKILKTKGRSHTWYCSVEGFLAKRHFGFHEISLKAVFGLKWHVGFGEIPLVAVFRLKMTFLFLWCSIGVSFWVENDILVLVKFHWRQFSGWKWHFVLVKFHWWQFSG